MQIVFNEGYYNMNGRPFNVAGIKFQLSEEFRVSRNGDGYVTVDGRSVSGFPERNIKISCVENNYRLLDEVDSIPIEVPVIPKVSKSNASVNIVSLEQDKISDDTVAHESDSDIIERIRMRFSILKEMTKAVKSGNVRAMIVTGPPGVGKSFGVEEVLTLDDLFNTIGSRKPTYEIVKGSMSALGLYMKLHEYSDENSILVFDDCDSILLDDVSLNILKGALDSSKKRTISWNSNSHVLRNANIPKSFEFKGGAIFITNINFEYVRSKKLRDHLMALESRCHYIDLKMNTEREKVLRIEQIVKDGMLDCYDLETDSTQEIINFIKEHRANMRELSLRTVLKIADLYKSFPDEWQSIARVTVMKGAA
jgi:hypothetical protein